MHRILSAFADVRGCGYNVVEIVGIVVELQASGLHAAPCRHGTTRRVVRRLAGFGRVRPHEVAGNDDGVVDFV